MAAAREAEMGRPKGSHKAKHVEIDGHLERPEGMEGWELQLVQPRLEALLANSDGQPHTHRSDCSDVAHDKP